MKIPGRKLRVGDSIWATAVSGWSRWLPWKAAACVAVMVTIMAASGKARAQAAGTEVGATPGVFVSGGLQNVQYPAYSDNSLGASLGAFVQPYTLAGVEVRAGGYPVSARFVQTEFTAGWRVGITTGLYGWRPFGYGGGGISRAQDLAADRKTVVANWDGCWQGTVGLDREAGSWSLRLFELTYRKTYTPMRELKSLEANVGLVYRFVR